MKVVKELVAINEIIEKLEDWGYDVSLQHVRFEYPEEMDNGHWVQGMTIVDIADKDVLHIYRGFSLCSVKDHFCKVTGTQMAFSRAMESLSEQVGRADMKEMLDD